jgi:hypothetical protein
LGQFSKSTSKTRLSRVSLFERQVQRLKIATDGGAARHERPPSPGRPSFV